MGYFANFMVYTFAMIGIIAIALLVFKNTNSLGGSGKSKCLKVLDTLSIAPRKTLYIVSTGRENFLIAGDVDKTTLISKLETRTNCQEQVLVSDEKSQYPTYSESLSKTDYRETNPKFQTQNYIDKSNINLKTNMVNLGN